MSFGWDTNKKIEFLEPGTRQAVLGTATPNYIIHHPYGFRQEDIVQSLCLAVSELIDMAEAEAAARIRIEEVTRRSLDVQDKTQRENNDSDTADDSQEVIGVGEERASVNESFNI